MTSHLSLSDKEFVRQFKDCSLNPALFNHEAHLRLSYIQINKYGLEIAILNLKMHLKKYVRCFGAEEKYNETLTEAATRSVYHFIMKSKSEIFIDFIREYPRLKTDFKSLMDSHYSDEIYNMEEAKRVFIEPDLLAFD
ncbi:hypothetical protein SAMN03097699_1302 [Flavobacteriaceae bacterium MAR_2010_188]|nr:hypothetical protein SAMN03097699_1302 [Flavobacteriaceae bacterium MAR_2010_188]